MLAKKTGEDQLTFPKARYRFHSCYILGAAIAACLLFKKKTPCTTAGNGYMNCGTGLGALFAGVEYFDVTTEGEFIVLRPLKDTRAEEVRERLASLGIEEQDVAAATEWARRQLR